MKSITAVRAVLAPMVFILCLSTNSSIANNFVDQSDCPKNAADCEGKRIWKDGTVYEGAFKFGEPSGYGTMTWLNGSTYEGEFLEGVRHGEGLQKNDDGSIYKGKFVNGFMHGQGAYSFPCGHQYIGEFYQDKMDGYGSIQFIDGTAYTGNWKLGKPHGAGKFLREDGSTISTIFHKGQRDGAGSIEYQGNLMECTWKNNKLNGPAIVTFANGEQLTCDWKKGVLVKENCTYTFQDGSSANKSIDQLLAKQQTSQNVAWLIYLEGLELKNNDQKDKAKVRFQIAKNYLPLESDLHDHVRASIKELK